METRSAKRKLQGKENFLVKPKRRKHSAKKFNHDEPDVFLPINDLCHRFPHISEIIFNYVEDKDLKHCKEVCKTWCTFINKKSFYWTRLIQDYAGKCEEFSEDWTKFFHKIPLDIIQEFAKIVKQFYGIRPIRRKYQWSPLHLTAESGHSSLSKYIIQKTGVSNPKRIIDGWTPLHSASLRGHIEVAQHIIENLQDINPKRNDGWTPLHCAAQNGHVLLCQIIIPNVKDKNPADNDGWTPLHYATTTGRLEVCQYICDNVQDRAPRNKHGKTPLHSAACSGRLDVFKLMFELMDDNDKNPTSNNGCTPLHAAAQNGHLDIFKFIYENIAEKNPQNVNGWLPLHYAAYNGHEAICKFIHESGSSLNPKTNRGWTPLHFAVCNGHFQVCKLIVKVIDGKTLTNTKGLTQAEMAAKGYEKVQQLMENNNP